MTTRALAFFWLVVVGTNVAAYHSMALPWQGAILLAGAAWVLVAFHREVLRLVFAGDWVLALAVLGTPVLAMLVSDRAFERGDYTSQIGVVLAFVVASALAMRPSLDRTLAFAALAIVAVAASLDLYELFVENNRWSVAPGRSAGFYVNPNISAEALVGYGLVFLTFRRAALRLADFAAMALVVVGTVATFSRAGILAGVVLLAAAAMLRAAPGRRLRTAAGTVAVGAAGLAFAAFVVATLDLSEDATARILSLVEAWGIGDYGEARGEATLAAVDLIALHPWLGNGVGTIEDMPEGPHNMFLAMLVEYGIPGLVAYMALIGALFVAARQRPRAAAAPALMIGAWLLAFSFSSHNLLGNPMTIPLLGFAVARAWRLRSAARDHGLRHALA
ncbi:MAG TPA: O-antigen ligase family protein [Casimicrobiaceae bacterium]|nr:O-antigen ligase family protein [Casimicrobiaceae bacterium]